MMGEVMRTLSSQLVALQRELDVAQALLRLVVLRLELLRLRRNHDDHQMLEV
jgi:uncharacterized coiled-coil protein SlyX